MASALPWGGRGRWFKSSRPDLLNNKKSFVSAFLKERFFETLIFLIKMKNKTYYKTNYKSPLGNIVICCDEQENIVGLWFEKQKHFADNIDGKITENNNLKIFTKVKSWLYRYFVGNKPNIKEIPVKFIGNDFRKSVWKILCTIPYGEVVTYGDIATQIAQQKGITKMSAQAIGGAVGHNPISIIVPCHRVVGKNGKLTGYAAGVDKKKKLLEIEQVNMVK